MPDYTSSVSIPCDLCERDRAIPRYTDTRLHIARLTVPPRLRNSATSGNFPAAFIQTRPAASKGHCSTPDHTHAYTTLALYRGRSREKLLKRIYRRDPVPPRGRGFLRRNVGIWSWRQRRMFCDFTAEFHSHECHLFRPEFPRDSNPNSLYTNEQSRTEERIRLEFNRVLLYLVGMYLTGQYNIY